MTAAAENDLREAARALVPTLRQRAEEVEATRRLPDDLSKTLAQAGSTGLTRGHKSRHQEGRGSRRGRDHGHTPAHHSDGEGQAERPEQTHLGIHTGNAGEGNGFGNHREGHHQNRTVSCHYHHSLSNEYRK